LAGDSGVGEEEKDISIRMPEWSGQISGPELVVLVILLGLVAWFFITSFSAQPYDRDFRIYALTSLIFLGGYILYLSKAVRPGTALIMTLFLSTLVLHLATAYGDHLAALDPYWHYKWMQEVYNKNQIPELDDMVYPMRGGLLKHDIVKETYVGAGPGYGLNNRNSAFFSAVFYGTAALALKPFGVPLGDVAFIMPGVIASFCAVLIYLLVVEMFSDMKPYNRIAAAAAAFILMFSPAFATKAVATNCEDDALGMLLMLAGFYFFFTSVNRKRYVYAVLSGLALLLLRITWQGWLYAFMVIGVFSFFYAIVRFINKKDCIQHLPYLAICLGLSQLWPLLLHARGGMPAYDLPPLIAGMPIAGAFAVSVILEAFNKNVRGISLPKIEGGCVESRVQNILVENLNILMVLAIVVGVMFVYNEGVGNMIEYILNSVGGVDKKSVVGDTIAEQNPLVGGSITYSSIKAFLREGNMKYGFVLIYGILMMPVMAYMAFRKHHMGALFVLAWSIPMIWGVYHKSAWIFASSAAVTVLGSTVGLFAVASRKDFDGYRVVGMLMLLILPVSYIPFTLGHYGSNIGIGYMILHSGASRDRYLWEEALVWQRDNTPVNSAVLTWWDYGHWLTSISHRPVLIDNLQADQYEIQDVARFFVNASSEEEAFKTVLAYQEAYEKQGRSLDYVMIDWTMIGKTSALHYISLGDIERNIKPDPRVGFKSYGQCAFDARYSVVEPRISIKPDGTYSYIRELVYNCGGNHVLGLKFTVSGNPPNARVDKAEVLMPDYVVPWSQWMEVQDASILGVYRLDDILACGIYWNQDEMRVCRFSQPLHTLIYVPQEFQDYMLTRLYLGDHVESYGRHGLVNRDYEDLRHFNTLEDFSGGFVRSYGIDYEGGNLTSVKREYFNFELS